MTDREIRRLRREDLLQILIDQQRRIDELTASLEETKAALESKRLALDNVGSIAEATLNLHGVFESAEKAAKQYSDEIMARADEVLQQAQAEADRMKAEAEEYLQTARERAGVTDDGELRIDFSDDEPRRARRRREGKHEARGRREARPEAEEKAPERKVSFDFLRREQS